MEKARSTRGAAWAAAVLAAAVALGAAAACAAPQDAAACEEGKTCLCGSAGATAWANNSFTDEDGVTYSQAVTGYTRTKVDGKWVYNWEVAEDSAVIYLADPDAEYAYDRGKCYAELVVVLDGEVLEEGVDYERIWNWGFNVGGVQSVSIEGIGDYCGLAFSPIPTIVPAELVGTGTFSRKYDASWDYSSLTKSAFYWSESLGDYVAAEKDSLTMGWGPKPRAIGEHEFTVTGTGNYTGSVTGTYTIYPADVEVKSLKSNAKRKATLKWKKGGGGVSYEIRYRVRTYTATGRLSATKWKTVKVKASKASYTIKKLKSGRKVQVQIRAYKKVGGKTYYSDNWVGQRPKAWIKVK